MLDLTVAEAWLLYCRDSQECRVPKKEQLSLLEFKCEAAACLCAEKKIQKRKGRPSSDVEEKHAEKQAKRACSPIALYISSTGQHWTLACFCWSKRQMHKSRLQRAYKMYSVRSAVQMVQKCTSVSLQKITVLWIFTRSSPVANVSRIIVSCSSFILLILFILLTEKCYFVREHAIKKMFSMNWIIFVGSSIAQCYFQVTYPSKTSQNIFHNFLFSFVQYGPI